MTGAGPGLPLGPDELRAALAAHLGAEPTQLRHRRSAYSTSFPVHEVDVEVAGAWHRFACKDLRRDSLDAAGRLVKHPTGHDPAREVGAYRHVLGDPAGPAALVAADDDPVAPAWLLLEWVAARELYQWGEPDAWAAAAAWLARFHRRWSDAAARAAALARVPARHHDDAHHGRLAAVAATDPVLAAAWGRAAALLDALPRTLVHGECYASDVLVGEPGTAPDEHSTAPDEHSTAPDEHGTAPDEPRDPGGRRVAVVDWETLAVGTGWVDLAALVTGWDPTTQDALVAAYLTALGPELAPPDPDAALAAARLAQALRWLGADPAWDAPSEHRRDWRAEAHDAAAAGGFAPGPSTRSGP